MNHKQNYKKKTLEDINKSDIDKIKNRQIDTENVRENVLSWMNPN